MVAQAEVAEYAADDAASLTGGVLSENMVVSQSAETEEGVADSYQETLPVQVRENFNETAFFYPSLLTNAEGDVMLQFTLPESNTTWKFQALANTADMKYGMLTKE